MNRMMLLACTIALAACDQQPAGQQKSADILDNAAQQSDPKAAAVLQDAADDARAMDLTENVSAVDSFAQNALEEAANTQKH